MELADLAQVPAKYVEILRNGLSCELTLPWGKPAPVKLSGSRRLALIQLRHCTTLARELSVVLSQLDHQALEALRRVDFLRQNRAWMEEKQRLFAQEHPGKTPPEFPPRASFPEAKPYLDNLPKITKELAELVSEAHSFLRAGPRPKPRGRPRVGAFSTIFAWSLAEFTLRLLLHVRAAGGQLTVDKNHGDGTLVDALNLLRPHLPRGFIPRNLPMATLDKVRTLDKKIALEPRSPANI